jgi:hypothetical protein
MRFFALLRKELRECMPWMILAALIFLAIGGANLWQKSIYKNSFRGISVINYSKSVISYEDFLVNSPLQETGMTLLSVSIGLGLVLGFRQFWITDFLREWGFLIHRSVNRGSILLSKLTAAIIAFSVSIGLLWSLFFSYSCITEIFVIPSPVKHLADGWFFILLGFTIYAGTALSGLSSSRWYSTKIFGLLFAGIIVISVFGEINIYSGFVMVIVCLVLLLLQVYSLFLNREF